MVLAEHQLKRLERRLPVMDHLPVARCLPNRQVGRFERRVVVGENAPVAGQLAQAHVQRFDGVGRGECGGVRCQTYTFHKVQSVSLTPCQRPLSLRSAKVFSIPLELK